MLDKQINMASLFKKGDLPIKKSILHPGKGQVLSFGDGAKVKYVYVMI